MNFSPSRYSRPTKHDAKVSFSASSIKCQNREDCQTTNLDKSVIWFTADNRRWAAFVQVSVDVQTTRRIKTWNATVTVFTRKLGGLVVLSVKLSDCYGMMSRKRAEKEVRNANRPCANTCFNTFRVTGECARQYFTDFVVLSFERALIVIQLLEVWTVESFGTAWSWSINSLASEFFVELGRFCTLLNVTVNRYWNHQHKFNENLFDVSAATQSASVSMSFSVIKEREEKNRRVLNPI